MTSLQLLKEINVETSVFISQYCGFSTNAQVVPLGNCITRKQENQEVNSKVQLRRAIRHLMPGVLGGGSNRRRGLGGHS